MIFSEIVPLSAFFTYVAFSAPIVIVFLLHWRHSSIFCVFTYCFLEYCDDVFIFGLSDLPSLRHLLFFLFFLFQGIALVIVCEIAL